MRFSIWNITWMYWSGSREQWRVNAVGAMAQGGTLAGMPGSDLAAPGTAAR
ncbi:MAG: hypothetical protein ACRD3Q_05960 [Terriglobales bacterium]